MGNHLWTVQLTPSGASTNALANEEAIDMEVENNELYVLGNTTSPFKGPLIGAGDSFLLRLDPSNGSEIEGIQFGTTAIDASRSISVDGLNVYLIGTTQGDLAGTGNAGDYDIFVRKYLLPPTIIDDDSDTIDDSTDNCAPLTYCPSNYSSCYNPDQLDSDSDLAGDVCDSCPASVGSCSGSDSQTCDSSGCTLSVADPNSGGFNTITVPAGTLSEPTSFSMTMFDSSPPGFDFFDVGVAENFSLFFVFTPSGLTFSPPVTIEIRYNDGFGYLAQSGDLTIFQNSGGNWNPVPGSCVPDADYDDTSNGSCFVEVTSFSAFVVAGPGGGTGNGGADVSTLSATLKKKNALENMLLSSKVMRNRFKSSLLLACAEKLGNNNDKAKAQAELAYSDEIALLSNNGKNKFSKEVKECAEQEYLNSVEELIDIKCFRKDVQESERNGARFADAPQPPKEEFESFGEECESVLRKELLNEPIEIDSNGDDRESGIGFTSFFTAPVIWGAVFAVLLIGFLRR